MFRPSGRTAQEDTDKLVGKEAPAIPQNNYKEMLLGKLCNWVPSSIYELLLFFTTIVGLVIALKTQQVPSGLLELWLALAGVAGGNKLKPFVQKQNLNK